jgi:uncharacterized protein involved in exopolysaccharide biosynthesis
MDVGEFFRLMLRRWAVAVPALILTVAITVVAYAGVHTQYESQVQMTMLNAPKITAQQGNYGNPYLAFDEALLVDVDFLSRNLSADSAAQKLKALGVTGYTAAIANNALGPFMQLTITSTNRAQILPEMQTLIHFSERQWVALQRSSAAPPGSIVQLSVIAPPSAPAPVLKRKIEVVAGVFIGGLLLTVLLVAMVESMARRRDARRIRPSARSERTAQAVPMR